MELLKQAEIATKRGEFCLADMLREIVSEESVRQEKAKVLRRKASEVVLCDEDY